MLDQLVAALEAAQRAGGDVEKTAKELIREGLSLSSLHLRPSLKEEEGYALRTPEGIWHFKCPKCAFQFAKSDEAISGPLDCPRCLATLIVRTKISSSDIDSIAKENGFWKLS